MINIYVKHLADRVSNRALHLSPKFKSKVVKLYIIF